MNESRLPEQVKLTPIPAFTDNYIWCLHNDTHAVVVDPGDAAPVQQFCAQHQLSLAAILITHHHHDHTGGIAALTAANSDLPVIGPRGGHIQGLTKTVTEGDSVALPVIDCDFTVLTLAGHTLDHIGFFGHKVLFCGDTLFSAGCGRLFEGSPEQMYQALTKLSRLPATTQVCCAHEYTLANLKFALTVEPENTALQAYKDWAEVQRQQGLPTLPSDIHTQNEINPFLRCHKESVKESVNQYHKQTLTRTVDTFAGLRKWKDEF